MHKLNHGSECGICRAGDIVDHKSIYINFLTKHCLGKTHLRGFNDWIGKTIYDNITSASVTTQSGHTIRCINLEVRSPSYTKNNIMYKLTPAYAKAQLLPYTVNLVAEMTVTDVIFSSPNIDLGHVPVMVKSIKCNLHGLTDAQLVACGEDPSDVGGYFIINGSEYVVMYMEKLDMNKFIMFSNKKEKGDMDVSITTLNETRKTSMNLVYYSNHSKMIMVCFPSLNTPSSSRHQTSVNILHVLNIVKFGGLEKFDALVAMYFTSKDKKLHKKLLYRLSFNKANFTGNTDSVAVIAALLPYMTGKTDEQKEAAVLNKVQKDIFSHISYYFVDKSEEDSIKYQHSNRIHIIAYCTAMLLEQLAGKRKESDRDSWSNKRIEASSKSNIC